MEGLEGHVGREEIVWFEFKWSRQERKYHCQGQLLPNSVCSFGAEQPYLNSLDPS